MCTLSCLQQHPRSTIVADEDATLELKVKTVKVRMPEMTNGTLERRADNWRLVLYERRVPRNADHQEQTRSRGFDDFLLGR